MLSVETLTLKVLYEEPRSFYATCRKFDPMAERVWNFLFIPVVSLKQGKDKKKKRKKTITNKKVRI